jgi:hypothetical protein
VDVAHVAPKVDRKPYPEHEKRNRRVLQHHYVLRRHTKATTQTQTHTQTHAHAHEKRICFRIGLDVPRKETLLALRGPPTSF